MPFINHTTAQIELVHGKILHVPLFAKTRFTKAELEAKLRADLLWPAGATFQLHYCDVGDRHGMAATPLVER